MRRRGVRKGNWGKRRKKKEETVDEEGEIKIGKRGVEKKKSGEKRKEEQEVRRKRGGQGESDLLVKT